MCKFYYDVMKPKYGENIKMVYTDTDSFVFHIKTVDMYEDLNTIKKEIYFQIFLRNINVMMRITRKY